jgi:hypothetical protein|tara:strand:- start:1182 stop:1619 length:438 start_codon:yes stop_codon:yes gene_type:complete
MANFAEINSDNVVIDIVFIDNENITPDENNTEEQKGIAFLKKLFGSERTFVQCSYGTVKNKYYVVNAETGEYTYDENLQHKKFRKNMPQPNSIWDPGRDCFYEPRMYDSWIFNENTGCYEAPIPYPSDLDHVYEWDEVNQQWIIV